MAELRSDQLAQMETTCGSLLYELQLIWDEVGEPDGERDKMLFELEQECLGVYRRKVDQANRARAQLRQAIADAEAELAAISSAMGERPVHIRQSNQKAGTLKEEIKIIIPHLEEMRRRKSDRWKQFVEVIEQIKKITTEISPTDCTSMIDVDESDLSLKMLEDLHRQLQALQKEKSDRLKQVLEQLNTLNLLCLVLGMDFKNTVSEIHPTLDGTEGPKNVSNEMIEKLASAIQRLLEVKIQRMQKLQDLATTMLELWNLMDTPIEEQQLFQNVTCNIAASEHEITEANTLSLDFINYVGKEVSRLEELKTSKMKDLVMKKKTELEELRRRTHLIAEGDSCAEFPLDEIESGAVNPSLVLEQIEAQISSVKEEAFSRKEILERVGKWLAACEEESWLEEYNRDENRYSAGRGSHLALKRAEKARTMVNKIPAIVDSLAAKVTSWEIERGTEFIYDGVRVLSMLDEYNMVRQEKEEERKRQRDQKKLQGQLIAEQEVLFGSKPSPSRPQSAKKLTRSSTGSGSNRRLSLATSALMQPSSAKSTLSTKNRDEGADISPSRRGHDAAGLQAKKVPLNDTSIRDVETPRMPFAPIVAGNAIPGTPQNIPIDAEMNKTPVTTPVARPKTPSTVSAPMQMVPTPAPSYADPEAATVVKKAEIEFSFEERRLDRYLNR